MIRRLIYKILGKFNLSIRKIRPRESIKYFKEYFGNRKIIGAEVGVQFGMNARDMLENLNLKKLYLIDPYGSYEDSFDGKVVEHDFSDAQSIAIKNVEKWKGNVCWINKNSDQAIKDISDELDFVFIDANHSYEFVKRDIENYWNKIKKGGILSGDDFTIYDVARAVVEFEKEKKVKVFIKAKDKEWFIIKK